MCLIDPSVTVYLNYALKREEGRMRKKGAAHIKKQKKNVLSILTTDFSLLVHRTINKDQTIETCTALNKGKDSDIIFDCFFVLAIVPRPQWI